MCVESRRLVSGIGVVAQCLSTTSARDGDLYVCLLSHFLDLFIH